MKVSAVITANKLRSGPVNSGNFNGIIIVFLSLAIGLLSGTVIYALSDESLFASLGEYFISFSTDFSNKNKPEILSGLILSDIPYVLIMLILGTSSLGTVPALLLSFLKSAGIGAVVSHLYTTYSLKGIEYCILMLFPSEALRLFAMLVFTHSCYVTSIKVYKCVKGVDSDAELNKYFMRSALMFIVFLMASFIRFLTVISFSSLVSFN